MLIRIWRCVTLLLVALAMGTSFAHTLELPAKMAYDGPLWVRLQNSLYARYWRIGGPAEVGGLLGTVALAILVRRRRPAFPLTLGAAASLALAFPVLFLQFNQPVNVAVGRATPEAVPAEWERLRTTWEYGHAARFALHVSGLLALLLSILAETPTEHRKGVRP